MEDWHKCISCYGKRSQSRNREMNEHQHGDTHRKYLELLQNLLTKLTIEGLSHHPSGTSDSLLLSSPFYNRVSCGVYHRFEAPKMFYLKLSLKELLLQSLAVFLSITIYYTSHPFEVFFKISLGETTFPVIGGLVEMSKLILHLVKLKKESLYFFSFVHFTQQSLEDWNVFHLHTIFQLNLCFRQNVHLHHSPLLIHSPVIPSKPSGDSQASQFIEVVTIEVQEATRLIAANQYITEVAKQHSGIEVLITEQMVIDNITVDIIIY
ncbi:MAG: hypothetical protein EZS28_000243 [Streblomastix strix]|uniref:Uncharacterized protein n=1 Tax=Streblomastix strix TaxID=222440 RepID=A0A5J4XAU0_9EUKA|nr:MAG: hypothetical protein EZS28_000243 [Streblomastix strix]